MSKCQTFFNILSSLTVPCLCWFPGVLSIPVDQWNSVDPFERRVSRHTRQTKQGSTHKKTAPQQAEK